MKYKILIGILFTALISGCASATFVKNLETYEFNSERAYIGFYVEGSYQIGLKDLDTNEELNFIIKNSKDTKLKVLEIPEGDYAIKYIIKRLGFLGTNLRMPVPHVMKTLISVQNNNLIYIGNLSSTVKRGFNSSTHYLNFDYTMDEFINDIEENYYYSDNFDVTSINYLTLATNEESNFKF